MTPPQARSQSGYVAELQDMVEELQAAQSLVQDQKHSHQAEVSFHISVETQ